MDSGPHERRRAAPARFDVDTHEAISPGRIRSQVHAHPGSRRAGSVPDHPPDRRGRAHFRPQCGETAPGAEARGLRCCPSRSIGWVRPGPEGERNQCGRGTRVPWRPDIRCGILRSSLQRHAGLWPQLRLLRPFGLEARPKGCGRRPEPLDPRRPSGRGIGCERARSRSASISPNCAGFLIPMDPMPQPGRKASRTVTLDRFMASILLESPLRMLWRSRTSSECGQFATLAAN